MILYYPEITRVYYIETQQRYYVGILWNVHDAAGKYYEVFNNAL